MLCYDEDQIELDLSEPAFGAQRKIGRRKCLVDKQVINSRTRSVKVKSLMDHQLYSRRRLRMEATSWLHPFSTMKKSLLEQCLCKTINRQRPQERVDYSQSGSA